MKVKLLIHHVMRGHLIVLGYLILIISVQKVWAQEKPVVTEVRRVGMTVADIDRAVDFYTHVLDFQKISDKEYYGSEYEKLYGVFGLRIRVVQLQLGDEILELTDYLTPGGRPIPVDARSNDLWFQHIAIVVSDMEAAYQKLRKHQAQHVSTGPQEIPASNQAAAGIKAFYFRDPDDHNLEIIYFPPDKGKEKWHHNNGALFLGIDHTAIAVSHTERSLKFYRDLLGLQVAGESYNFGTEQAHLNNVEDASLHITGLKAATGPGVEFLEYLQPGAGRPFPSDTRADDLWHWYTTMVVPDIASTLRTLEVQNTPLVSSALTLLPTRSEGLTKSVLVRDPDGHAILLVEAVEVSVEYPSN